jgi:hypothetical protein
VHKLILMVFLALCGEAACAVESTSADDCVVIAPREANTVKSFIPDVAIDEYRNNAEDLAVMTGIHSDFNTYLGGITTANPLVDYEIEPNLAFLPDQNGVCARPAMKLTVGYSTMNVYMNIEIPRNTCIYNSIFSHEMHHVSIYKDYINHHIEQIRQSVEEKFDGKTYRFPTLFAAKQYVAILGQLFAQRVREKFLNEVYAEQEALDTQAEYSRIQLACVPVGHPF